MQKTYVCHLGGTQFGLVADLHKFGIKTCGGVRFDPVTGSTEYYDLKSPFEKLPSSFADMAIKFYHHTNNCIPYLALNASPKFLQGHNVYGTDFVYYLVCEMLGVLRDSYPVLWSFLDVQNAEFARIDVTYSTKLPKDDLMFTIIDMVGRISNNQRKPDIRRNIFANTRYWGVAKNRMGYCKMYGKNNEVADTIKSLRRKARADNRQAMNLLNNVFTDELEKYSKNLLRFEATNKKDMLVKQSMPTNIWQFMLYQKNNPNCLFELWQYWFNPILSSLEGELLMNIDDVEVLELCKQKLTVYRLPLKRQIKLLRQSYKSYSQLKNGYLKLNNLFFDLAYKSETKAKNAYRFYVFLKQKGYDEAKKVTSKNTFNDNVRNLVKIGISKAHLQNLNGREIKTVPLIELIQIDFSNQTPPDYQPVKSRYHGEFDNYLNPLRFVA